MALLTFENQEDASKAAAILEEATNRQVVLEFVDAAHNKITRGRDAYYLTMKKDGDWRALFDSDPEARILAERTV